jgi:methylmalonyl-CoA mutase cobalamin-binding domain/chain
VDRLEAIGAAVTVLDEKKAVRLVEEALAAGDNPVDVVHAVQAGMRAVGERYEQRDIYLSGLIMAGEIFRSVMAVAQPGLEDELAGDASGRVLLGTVAGDIHDIGKNMAALAFRMFGFTVEDLGVNVPPERFLEAARVSKPDIVGLSGLLSPAFTAMRDTVALLRKELAGQVPRPVYVIGGGTIDEQVATYVGADLWTDDAMAGVRLCRQALEDRGGATP